MSRRFEITTEIEEQVRLYKSWFPNELGINFLFAKLPAAEISLRILEAILKGTPIDEDDPTFYQLIDYDNEGIEIE